jgi:protein NRD1
VLSRTLFVGGVKTTETSLKAFFGQFGTVQSVIVNHEKRHAFLKMITHAEALATRQAVASYPESEYRHLFERVNWAVGFGPTKYADYNVGESVIPIDTLTDADRKWMVTAEFGGTGGQDIVQGMIVEEPDIEIGAGPSSKGKFTHDRTQR